MLEKKAVAADSVGVSSESIAAKTPAPLRDAHEAGPLSLEAIFQPRSVAVIGATERAGSVGRATFLNLVSASFGGKIFAVNPQHSEILGEKSYRSIGDVPGPVDLALIVTPAATVPGVVGECIDAGVKAAVVISAGFRERRRRGESARTADRAAAPARSECG